MKALYSLHSLSPHIWVKYPTESLRRTPFQMCCHTFFYVQVSKKRFEKMGLVLSVEMIGAKLDERWKNAPRRRFGV